MGNNVWERFRWSVYLARKLVEGRRLDLRDRQVVQMRQEKNLRHIVRHAYETVPYYAEVMRQRGLSPADFQSVDDLSKLPILERASLQRDPEYFVSRAVRRAACLAIKSSGSSGAPKTIWHDPASVFANAAHGERERVAMTRVIGRWTGYRETVIVSPIDASQHAVQAFVKANSWFPSKLRVERQYLFLSDPPEQNLKAMNDFRPDLLYAYGSYIEMLYRRFRQGDLPWHFPKAILYSSDGLSPQIRARITNELGIPVFSVYGAVEALKIGFECRNHSGFHVNADLYPVRIVDREGREQSIGEIGDVVLSNLLNRATVLLNYRLGDLAALQPSACRCGLSLPLLSPPSGRVDEIVELSDGTLVHPIVLREICLRNARILQYQVTQLALDRFLVSLITDPEADRQNIQSEIKAGFARRFGGHVDVDVTFVHELARRASGKTPTVMALGPQHHASPS